MSLINDALKKAQRLRAEPVPPGEPQRGPGGRIEKRRQPMRAQSVLLLCAFAAVLVVFSVIATVFLLNRPAPTVTRPLATARPAILPAESPAPNIVVPISAPAAPSSAVPTAPNQDTRGPASPLVPAARPAAGTAILDASPPADTAGLAAKSPPLPNAALPATEASPPASASTRPSGLATAPRQPDARIQAFVDAVKVTGIRSSGAESKVLLNDRVYRVNDVVERTFGLKLVKVEADQLTFVDPHGIHYTKNF